MSLSRKLNLAVQRLFGNRFNRPRPTRIDFAACRKILVVELWGLGDIVFLAPALKALAEAGGGRSIDVLVQPSSQALIDALGLPVRAVCYKIPWTHFTGKYRIRQYLRPALWRFISRLRYERYDLILSVRQDPREAALVHLLGPRRALGFASYGSAWIFTSTLPVPSGHNTDSWFRLLAHLGIGVSATSAFRGLQSDLRARAALRPSTAGDAIVLHSSARNPVRNWGAENFIRLGQLLEQGGYRIVWLQDANSSSPAAAGLPAHWTVFQGDLNTVLSALVGARLYIGNDGGLMHMADLFGARICGIFGPTDPGVFYPYGQPDSLVFVPGVPCRPCFDYCIYDKPICFNGIDPHAVHLKALDLLARPPLVHVGSGG